MGRRLLASSVESIQICHVFNDLSWPNCRLWLCARPTNLCSSISIDSFPSLIAIPPPTHIVLFRTTSSSRKISLNFRTALFGETRSRRRVFLGTRELYRVADCFEDDSRALNSPWSGRAWSRLDEPVGEPESIHPGDDA